MLLKITDDPLKQCEIGRTIVAEKPDVYSERIVNPILTHIEKMNGGGYITPVDKDSAFYRSVYDYWVYGSNIREEFYYNFFNKKHDEKIGYITFRSRFLYIDYLNKKEDRWILDDKFALYEKIKTTFRREMIKISNQEDYPAFEEFILKNPLFVIKPIDLGSASGVRKYDATGILPGDRRALFNALLTEAQGNKRNESWGRGRPSMVLEELIVQDKELARFHPSSLQVLRITTINDGQGNISLFKPWMKVGAHNSFTAAAATDGCCVSIDEKQGVLSSDGYSEDCQMFANHPDTGVHFKGAPIPEWPKAIAMCTELAKLFPTLRYIGWDVAMNDKKEWCIVEANSQADFCIQMMIGKGIKREFESLIGWKPDKQYWWE